MNEADVAKQIQREIASIQSRDGVLPPTPYLWAEIRTRLATLKPWEGLRAGESIGRGLRRLVEAATNSKPLPTDDTSNPCHMSPLEAAKAFGTKRHRHLRTENDNLPQAS